MSEESNAWHILDSRVVFEHRWLTLVEDTLIVPTGEQMDYLRFGGEPASVGLVCVDEHQRILLARQYNYVPGRTVYEFPGGGVEDGESLVNAARRELVEEVGLYPHRLDLLGSFLVDHRRSSGQQHVFIATEFESRQMAPDVGEVINFEWVSIDTIETMIRAGTIENMYLLAIWTLFKLKSDLFTKDR